MSKKEKKSNSKKKMKRKSISLKVGISVTLLLVLFIMSNGLNISILHNINDDSKAIGNVYMGAAQSAQSVYNGINSLNLLVLRFEQAQNMEMGTSEDVAETEDTDTTSEAVNAESTSEDVNTGTEEAIPDETVTDETVTDETVTDETVTDEVVPDETVTDETVTDEAVTDEAVTDETGTDGTEEIDRTTEIQAAIDSLDSAFSELEEYTNQITDQDCIDAYTEMLQYVDGFKAYEDAVLQAVENDDPSLIGAAMMDETIGSSCMSLSEQSVIVADLYEQMIDGKLDSEINMSENATKMGTVACVFGVLLSAAIALYLIFTIVLPAKRANATLKQMIQDLQNGNADLTARIVIEDYDEIGQMARGINIFVEELQTIMEAIRDQSSELTNSNGIINRRIEDTDSNLKSISENVNQLAAGTEEISATVTQMEQNSQRILDSSNHLMEETDHCNEFAQGMSKNADGVRDLAITSKETTTSMLQQMKESLEITIERSKNVSQISNLTSEILNISSQTNLLALNASIEAARAGEAGKGFAIVAEEIGQLAGQSRETANGIQEISDSVIESVEALSRNADELVSYVDENVIQDYDKFVDSSKQYQNDADHLKETMESFEMVAEEMKEVVDILTSSINNIAKAMEDNAGGISGTAIRIGDISTSITDILDETKSQEEVSDGLNKQIAQFKKI